MRKVPLCGNHPIQKVSVTFSTNVFLAETSPKECVLINKNRMNQSRGRVGVVKALCALLLQLSQLQIL